MALLFLPMILGVVSSVNGFVVLVMDIVIPLVDRDTDYYSHATCCHFHAGPMLCHIAVDRVELTAYYKAFFPVV